MVNSSWLAFNQETAEETDLEKCNFQNFRSPVTLTLDRVIWHTVVHQSSISIYIPNFIEIGKTFCGRTFGRTYGRTYRQTDISPSNIIRSNQRSRPKNQNILQCHYRRNELCTENFMKSGHVLFEIYERQTMTDRQRYAHCNTVHPIGAE